MEFRRIFDAIIDRDCLLFEGIKSARKVYVSTGKINEDDFKKIVEWDPSPTKKYVDWLCKQFAAGVDPIELQYGIQKFYSLAKKNIIQNKDINSYSMDEFNEELGKHQDEKSKTDFKKDAKSRVDKIYEDDEWLVVHPKTKEASCLYGANTKWCTAATKGQNYYDSYRFKAVKLYYFINKRNNAKFALSISSSGKYDLYNQQDIIVPISSVGIVNRLFSDGVLKPFSTEEKKAIIDEQVREELSKCTVDEDGYYSTNGSIEFSSLGFERLPVKFKHIGGHFLCSYNQLTSLEGAPQSVGGSFSCGGNELTSLEGAPQSVGGYFYCHSNKLTSLEGAPQEVGGKFDCSGNELTSLEGAPQSVGGNFDCGDNKLKDLGGAPDRVEKDFLCEGNPLESLFGAPLHVGARFKCPRYVFYRAETDKKAGLVFSGKAYKNLRRNFTEVFSRG